MRRSVIGPVMPPIAGTPEPPYHVVVFTSQRNDTDLEEYGSTSMRMVELVQGMEGFLGYESARDANGFGITVSYWRDAPSIARWKAHIEHLKAQGKGKASWYDVYSLRVGVIERDSGKGWKD